MAYPPIWDKPFFHSKKEGIFINNREINKKEQPVKATPFSLPALLLQPLLCRPG